jgi:hypothetical protein
MPSSPAGKYEMESEVANKTRKSTLTGIIIFSKTSLS